jgi:hypothetical protein
VVTDLEGNVFVAGIYWGAGEFAGVALPETEELDSFLAKLDQNGKLLWLKPIVGKGYETIGALAVTADGGVLGFVRVQDSLDFGGGTIDIAYPGGSVLFHYGPGGEYRFARRGSGSALALASNGDIVVAGGFSGVLDFGGGSIVSGGAEAHDDAFLARLDAEGNEIFVKVFGDDLLDPLPSESDQSFLQVAVAPDGTTYVLGDFSGRTTIDGTKLASGDVDAMIVAAFDPSGHALFARSFGEGKQDGSVVQSGRLALAPGGGIVVTGTLWGTLDLGGGPIQGGSNDANQGFLLALSPKGDFAWSRSVRSEGGGSISSMTTSSCFVQVAGLAKGQINLGDGVIGSSESGDGFVALLSPEGKLLDGRRFTGVPQTMAQRVDGSFVLGGSFYSKLAIGGISIDAPISNAGSLGFVADAATLAE